MKKLRYLSIILTALTIMSGPLHAQHVLWHRSSWPVLGFPVVSSMPYPVLSVGQTIFAAPAMGLPLFISNDNGITWRHDTDSVRPLWATGLARFGTSTLAIAWKYIWPFTVSSDTGKSWVASQIVDTASHEPYSHPKRVFVLDGLIFVSIQNTIDETTEYPFLVRSKDTGHSWERLPAGGSSSAQDTFHGQLNSMVSIDGALFVACGSALFRSNDSGSSWHQIIIDHNYPTNIGLVTLGHNLIAAYKTLEGKGEMFRSSDLGATWDTLQLPNPFVPSALTVVGDTLVAARQFGGIFFSTDVGHTWTEMDLGIENKTVMAFTSNGPRLFAAVDSGIYWADLNVVEGVIAPQPRSIQFMTLSPNPALDQASLFLTIDREAYVHIEVFDLLGHKLEGVGYEGVFEPGAHSTLLDLKSLRSGSYYVRITTANNEVRTIKLLKE
jgi:photosystem II stability/assembly factor-like uncharacterized protein